jgi:mono/diheme cytochrome c family protein
MLRVSLAIIAACAGALTLGAGFRPVGAPLAADPERPLLSAAAVASWAPADGRAIYTGKGNCASCHGPEATGTPLGPDLTDEEWLNITGTLEEITGVVRSGVLQPKSYPAPMPPMGGARLRPAEIEAVARYVFELRPVAAP